MHKPRLYGYWRSSASYRVRIACELKGIDYENCTINLVKGEHKDAAHRERNPQMLVPTWQDEQVTLGQSQAIIEYLEERYPERALLPQDAALKAQHRAMAQIIACEVHPLDNLSVLRYLTDELGVDEDAKIRWYHHWIERNFAALEEQSKTLFGAGALSLGEQAGYFEAFLVPQMYNARRFNCTLDAYPNLCALDEQCRALGAFENAAPEKQPDAN